MAQPRAFWRGRCDAIGFGLGQPAAAGRPAGGGKRSGATFFPRVSGPNICPCVKQPPFETQGGLGNRDGKGKAPVKVPPAQPSHLSWNKSCQSAECPLELRRARCAQGPTGVAAPVGDLGSGKVQVDVWTGLFFWRSARLFMGWFKGEIKRNAATFCVPRF